MILIQPQYRTGDVWNRFAVENDLYYEALEPFSPPNLGNPELFGLCTAWYNESKRTRSIHGAFVDVNPASGDPELRDLSRRRSYESCDIARATGAEYVVLHGSCFPFLRGGYINFWADSCSKFYAELSAAYPDLKICLENSMDIDTTPLEMLIERVQEPNFCVCLDIGHAQYSGTPIKEWFEKLGDKIEYLHLSDNGGRFDDHNAIGDGIIDWVEVDALYRSLGRKLPITLEVGGIEDIERSIRFLREKQLMGI